MRGQRGYESEKLGAQMKFLNTFVYISEETEREEEG